MHQSVMMKEPGATYLSPLSGAAGRKRKAGFIVGLVHGDFCTGKIIKALRGALGNGTGGDDMIFIVHLFLDLALDQRDDVGLRTLELGHDEQGGGTHHVNL
jgi:hypothetical protein